MKFIRAEAAKVCVGAPSLRDCLCWFVSARLLLHYAIGSEWVIPESNNNTAGRPTWLALGMALGYYWVIG